MHTSRSLLAKVMISFSSTSVMCVTRKSAWLKNYLHQVSKARDLLGLPVVMADAQAITAHASTRMFE